MKSNEDRIQNIERQLQKQQDQLTQQTEMLQSIIHHLLKKDENRNENQNVEKRFGHSSFSSSPTSTPFSLSSSSPSSSRSTPSSSPIPKSAESVIPQQIIIPPRTPTAVTTITPTMIEPVSSKKSSAVIIRHKKKRAIMKTKEICKSFPPLIKPKPVDSDGETSSGKRKRKSNSFDDQALKDRVTTISPVSDLQRKTPENLSDRTYPEITPSVSTQIDECKSYLSLYNLLNGFKSRTDQYAAILQISQFLESPESSKWYQTFLDSQGGVVLFVRWLRDLSQHVHSLSSDAIILKLIQTKSPLSASTTSSSSSPPPLSTTVFHQDRLTYDGRIFVLSMIQLLEKIKWTKDMTFTTRVDKVIKSFYKYYTSIGNLLQCVDQAIGSSYYQQLGKEFLEFSQHLKDPWARYRQLLSGDSD